VTQPNQASTRPREAVLETVLLPDAGTGERSERRRAHRRLAREQLLAFLILVAALAITIAVLLSQWMGGASGGQPGQPGQPLGSGAPARPGGAPVGRA
jgi:hypothetical protein